jgi:orotate phosphoribosyltransferase
VASEYFDKYKFEASPDILREIAQKMVELIPPETEILAGLELGAFRLLQCFPSIQVSLPHL